MNKPISYSGPLSALHDEITKIVQRHTQTPAYSSMKTRLLKQAQASDSPSHGQASSAGTMSSGTSGIAGAKRS